MTIEKGANWGEVVAACDGGILATGDLARELGVDERRATHDGPWLRLPLDMITVEAIDSRGRHRERVVTSWLTAGSRMHGDFLIVSSTSFVGGRRIFSRAHPNDGRLDWLALHPGMSLRQRMAFRRRTRTESHLPHPLVSVGTGASLTRSFARPATVRFESAESMTDVVELTATIRPDAAFTHIPAS
ncbi:MAG: hypothetical protein ACKOA5_01155 [Actinomycetota bacterium]